MAETGYTSYADQGTGAHLLQAAKDTPVAKDGVSIVQDIVKDIQSQKFDIGSLAGDVSSFASDATTALKDPLNALISAGLGFLMDVITPLRDELQKVTGDSAALDKGKEAFAEVGTELGKLTTELKDITSKGFQSWTGAAKDAASAKVDTFVKGVQGTVNNAEDIANLLSISSQLMEAAYNLVMGIIADLIEWLIVTWVAALAAEIPTLGGSTVAAGAATAAEVGVEGANAAEKVQQATSLVEKITSIFKKIKAALDKLKALHKTLNEGKDVTKAAKDVNKLADEAKKLKKEEEKAKKLAGEKTSLADKAKDFAKNQIDERWTQPKENLQNLIHNPKGVLQNLAHDSNDDLKGHFKDIPMDLVKEAGAKVWDTYKGDLIDQVVPSSDPVAQARHDGPNFLSEDHNQTIDQDLQG